MIFPKRSIRATLLLVTPVVLTLGGCAAAVPIVSAAATGASAGEAGYSFWNSGLLTYVDEGTIDEMNRSVALTIERLRLTARETKDRHEDGALQERWWSLASDRGHLVTLTVEPLTRTMVEVRINAGTFGNRAAAELFADRLKQELDAIQAGEPSPGQSQD
tara:strand:- start:2658 stop:3140 length:483 start_codon:yes stop_codon:yes gene_type:complete